MTHEIPAKNNAPTTCRRVKTRNISVIGARGSPARDEMLFLGSHPMQLRVDVTFGHS